MPRPERTPPGESRPNEDHQENHREKEQEGEGQEEAGEDRSSAGV